MNKCCCWTAGIVFALGCLTLPVRGGTVVTNGGFETGTLADWTTFGNTIPNVMAGTGEAAAHGGVWYLKTFGQFTGNPNASGVYQDIPATAGTIYSADGWAFTLGSDGGGIHGQSQTWMEISFLDASGNPLALYRSTVVTGGNLAQFGGTNVWFDLPVTNEYAFTFSGGNLTAGAITNTSASLVAPAGTAAVRYQVVFYQGADNANGSMFFDDLTLNPTGTTGVVSPPAPQWNIVWDDEFNGTAISTNWSFETGNNSGWGNGELEYYTGRTNNAYVSGGLLHIVARSEAYNSYSFTSARMQTLGSYSTPVYGRFVWRARLPAGTGMWPALWLMGADYPSVGWPTCGEIDVVENNGANPTFVQGSLHSNNGNPTLIDNLPGGETTTTFHTYMLDWESNSIAWYVDGQLYETQNGGAPFNAPFFFLLNVAVGGDYVGGPSVGQINAGTVFPQELQVDYVRVYELTAPLQVSVTQTGGRNWLNWPAGIVCHLQAQTNSLNSAGWSDLPVTSGPFALPVATGNTRVFYRLESP